MLSDKNNYRQLLQEDPPIFGERVDNPWEEIPDILQYNQRAFQLIQRKLAELRKQIRKQHASTQGILVLGEAGTGKTHLLMRVAQKLSANNHILFIPRPHTAEGVAEHIWHYMLVSLTHSVPGLPHGWTQLDSLLSHVFANIFIAALQRNGKNQPWIKKLQESPENILTMLGKTEERRKKNITFLLRCTLGHLQQFEPDIDQTIARMLIHYCLQKNAYEKQVILTWLYGQQISPIAAQRFEISEFWGSYEHMPSDTYIRQQREEQAMRAIGTVGRLARYYQPLILTFDQLEGLHGDQQLTKRWCDTLREIFSRVNNMLIITCIFPSLWRDWFMNRLDRAACDRIAQNEIALDTLDANTAQQLLALRMQESYELYDLPNPLYPFTKTDVLDICQQYNTPRAFLQKAAKAFDDWLFTSNKLTPTTPEPPKDRFQQLTLFLKQRLNEIEYEYIQVYEDGIAHEEDFFGKIQIFIKALCKNLQANVQYTRANYRGLVIPPNFIVKPLHKGTSLCIAVCNSSGSPLSARLKNLIASFKNEKQWESILLLRDCRCPAPGAKTKPLFEKIVLDYGRYIKIDVNEFAIISALYDLFVAIQQKDIAIDGDYISEADFFKAICHSGIIWKSQCYRTFANFDWLQANFNKYLLAEGSSQISNANNVATTQLQEIASEDISEPLLILPQEMSETAEQFNDPILIPPEVDEVPLVDNQQYGKVDGYPRSFKFPSNSGDMLREASQAVHREYKVASKPKRLRCRNVQPVANVPNLFILDVGHALEFEWTWEGCRAWRPKNLDDYYTESTFSEYKWCGEVVEVEQKRGLIYVAVKSANIPHTGSFYLLPFEFLRNLEQIYNDPDFNELRVYLSSFLQACQGTCFNRIKPPEKAYGELLPFWDYSWSILWGPPGTGKTYNIGKQVSCVLEDESERILVVSTSNKATDEVAISIGKAIEELPFSELFKERIIRIGIGANYAQYQQASLSYILENSETTILADMADARQQISKSKSSKEKAQLRKLINDLREQTKDLGLVAFESSKYKVVVTTVFKAISLVQRPDIYERLANGQGLFSTLIIDEASMVAKAAVAALALLASNRVVLVGDPKQLMPIAKARRVDYRGKVCWLGESAIHHLNGKKSKNCTFLEKQYRMHPEICKLVSEYQYSGQLINAESVTKRNFTLKGPLERQPRAIWYVLNEDTDSNANIRADKGPGNHSRIRQRTYDIINKLFDANPILRTRKGLFLSPFKAQVSMIQKLLQNKQLATWEAGTIHSQQGAEADFVIVDTVAASKFWSMEEWEHLINVGISRAKEFLLLIASREEMDTHCMNGLKGNINPRICARRGRGVFWKKVPVNVSKERKPKICGDPKLMGNQIIMRKAMRPILSAEQQRLCTTNT